ncbi:MAG: alanine racemase [Nocardioidaceae bacterium]
MTDWARMQAATSDLDPPFAALDAAALAANADDLVRRAHGLPIRLASKSIRCRGVLEEVLARPGFAGVMAYSLREGLWLAQSGVDDVLVAYPSADRAAWRDLASTPDVAKRVSVVVDSVEHLDYIADVVPAGGVELRLCLEVDSSLRVGPVHIGVRRSPVHSPAEARALAEEVAHRDGMRLVGLMFYDAQIAGLPDSSFAVRWVKRRSADELLHRRAEVVRTVGDVADLEFVNAGGTGSLHTTGADSSLTELAAGSGLYGPTLFDGYRDFRPLPALFFALPVVRRPARAMATAFAGGYIASGPPGRSRVPQPAWPRGLSLLRAEGAGETQTPVRGRAARGMRVGDRVWFRHAKAGEMCERFDVVHRCDGEGTAQAGGATVLPTYRGEGQCFG